MEYDSNERFFVDVNPVCFQVIVDHLNEMTILSDDYPPNPISVDDEHIHILQHQLQLFGLLDKKIMEEVPSISIIKDEGHITQLHDWIKDDDLDERFHVHYHSSGDGKSDENFYSKYENKGNMTTIIKTTDGFVLGVDIPIHHVQTLDVEM